MKSGSFQQDSTPDESWDAVQKVYTIHKLGVAKFFDNW